MLNVNKIFDVLRYIIQKIHREILCKTDPQSDFGIARIHSRFTLGQSK